MSDVTALLDPRSRWTATKAKMFGWIVGLLIAFFGSLLYAVSFATYSGLSHVIVIAGLSLTLSYSIAMSGTSIPRPIVVLIGLLALAAVALGRYLAPMPEVIASIREGHDYLKGIGPRSTMGIPLLLIGIQILQLVTPWMRMRESMSWWRSMLAMICLQGGTIVLAVAACLTNNVQAIQEQPYWLWVIVPLAYLLGLGLRTRWQGYSWIVLALLSALTLPGIWVLLTHFERPAMTTQRLLQPDPKAPVLLATRPHDRLHDRLA
jgi:hypothetical protein